MFTLVIDSREKYLYKELMNLYNESPINNKDISSYITTKSLDIGDSIIMDNSNNYVLIFERKTVQDLISSIKDGRYLEQSYRLQNYNIPNHCITYIIEGTLYNPRQPQCQNTVISSIFSLNYSKQFSTLRTLNIKETAIYLLQYLKKINKQKNTNLFYSNTSSLENTNYSEVLKTCKKSNITTSNIGEIMLMQIPGVSNNCARAVMNKYKNIISLIVELQDDENCLENISILNDKSISRKISKTAVENIKTFLMQ